MDFIDGRIQQGDSQLENDGDTANSKPQGVTEDRRQTQRRAYFRVVYPPAAYPEITDCSAKVIDISVRALRFQMPSEESQKMNLAVDVGISANVKFHDGQLLEINGKILRRLEDNIGNSIFVCMFDREIPSAIINKEQAYLLKHFPEFCRKTFKFTMPPA